MASEKQSESAQLSPSKSRRRFLVPRSRRLTCDVLHFHKQVPLCPHHRMFDLAALSAVRKSCPTRVSWPVLFMKAYGLVSKEYPALCQAWMPFPWPSIYQHDVSIGMLAIHREYLGAPWLFWGKFQSPEDCALAQLQQQLDVYQTDPVKPMFSRYVRLSGVPNPFRRMLWWLSIQLSGARRIREIGTFFLSTLASRGVDIPMPPSFQTGVLSYGPIDERGLCRVTLAYDHRLMDGLLVAECLQRLEQILNGVLSDELQAMISSHEPKPA